MRADFFFFFFKKFSQQEEQFERQIEDNLSSLNVSSAGDKTPWFSQNSFPTHYQRNIDLTTVFNETLTGVFYENLMSHNFKKRLFWKNCALTTYATGQRILMTNCEGGIFFFFFFKKFTQREEQFERQMYRKFKFIKCQLCWR